MPHRNIETQEYSADLLIIGGGTSGCLAAVEAREKNPNIKIVIMEKAHIDRSGCLAAGMNAINAYINPKESVESFVRYVRADSCGLIREDLVASMAELFEYCVKKVEKWGLPVLSDENGNYLPRGRWNIKINGESLKPIIAKAAKDSGATILNWTVGTSFITRGKKVIGATGFNIRTGKFVVVKAKTTLIATGGAAGIYKPNNAHDAQHKTWYSPFNTGTGYAMGIRAGAEMTSLEMRYVALRTKDAIAPTGTIALGANAPQVNSQGEQFMKTKYGHLGGEGAPTPYRAYAPIMEMKEGRGPVYLDTTHISSEQAKQLKAAYLDMYPSQVLYWAANNIDPSKEPVEVQTTEPYVVGGHCQGGYWIDKNRQSTLENLYAAGDVAGGAPFKFVSGCWAEAVIAARDIAGRIGTIDDIKLSDNENKWVEAEKQRVFAPFETDPNPISSVGDYDMEVRLQKIMDEYAGGASCYYEMNEKKLLKARALLAQLPEQFKYLRASDNHELMKVHETIDRVWVAQALVEHMLFRQETRWPSYHTRVDYPQRDDDNWLCFANSAYESGKFNMYKRPYTQVVDGDRYKG